MLGFIMGVGIVLLVALLLGAGIWRVWKAIFPTKEEENPEYLEHYTTDGRLREDVFPNSGDNWPTASVFTQCSGLFYG